VGTPVKESDAIARSFHTPRSRSPRREVRIDERPEEVIFVVPCAAEDVPTRRPRWHRRVLEEWAQRGKVLEKWARRGDRCGAERDGGAQRSGTGSRCIEATTSEASGNFRQWGLCRWVEMKERGYRTAC
jgi:hypothetical protein